MNPIATREMPDEGGLSDEYEGGLLPYRENTNGQVRQTGDERSGRQRLRPWGPAVANESRHRTRACARAIAARRRRGAGAEIAPGAWGCTRPRELVNRSAESLVRRNTSGYFTISNLLRRRPVVNETSGDATPSCARLTSARDDGARVQIGLQETFGGTESPG